MEPTSQSLLRAARELIACVDALRFGAPVAYVYNPLGYAWNAHRSYLERFGGGRKRVLFLGMNPGPWGMAQTGVPFGDVPSVREWMGIEKTIGHPPVQHPRRPVRGFDLDRREISGMRLWGLMKDRFGAEERFFREHFVGNYCPLLFLDAGARNITPDRLRSREREALFRCCDRHLRAMILALEPEWLIGVGRFAERRLGVVGRAVSHPVERLAGILHPSPASPAANRNWAERVTERLVSLGVWNQRSDGSPGT
jgi:single-strand selective monofunctional uracil DNA glycosylase